VASTISSSKIRSSPPNTDISRIRNTENPAELISRPWQPSSRLQKDGSCCSSRYPLALSSHSFSRTSFSPGCSFGLPDRALHRGGEEGTNNARFITTSSITIRYYIYTYIYMYTFAILVTAGSRRVSWLSLFSSTDAGDTHENRPRDSHTLRAARTHNARTRFVMAIFGGKQLRAPTTRVNHSAARRQGRHYETKIQASFSSKASHFLSPAKRAVDTLPINSRSFLYVANVICEKYHQALWCSSQI